MYEKNANRATSGESPIYDILFHIFFFYVNEAKHSWVVEWMKDTHIQCWLGVLGKNTKLQNPFKKRVRWELPGCADFFYGLCKTCLKQMICKVQNCHVFVWRKSPSNLTSLMLQHLLIWILQQFDRLYRPRLIIHVHFECFAWSVTLKQSQPG